MAPVLKRLTMVSTDSTSSRGSGFSAHLKSSKPRRVQRLAAWLFACAPWGHAGSLIANGTALSFLYFAFSGFSRFGLFIFASVSALRLWMAWMVGCEGSGTKS